MTKIFLFIYYISFKSKIMQPLLYIQCPNKLESAPFNYKSIFFAGGITNCPVWQEDLKNRVSQGGDVKNLIVYNPRRKYDFDFQKESHFQISWEFSNLKSSDAVSFWFPRESVCPISLLELGTCLKDLSKTVFVGCHPEYARILDVKIQASLYRPEIIVVESIEELGNQIKNWASGKNEKKRKSIEILKKPLIMSGIAFFLGWILGRNGLERLNWLKK
jgi:Nucleoside 2-deoxyribosyltransferase like